MKDNAPGTAAHPEEHAHGESDVLLRTQTSGVKVHTMETQEPPIYMIAPGRVYRPESSWYNFTALTAPLDHPSRSARDPFYVKDNAPGTAAHPEEHAHGESDVLLRTQTSGVKVHTMETQEPPIYMIAPGRVYRPDTADACHMPQFNQI